MHLPASQTPFRQIRKLLPVMQELEKQPLLTKYEAIANLLKAVLHITSGLAFQTSQTGTRKNKRPQQIKQQFLNLLYQHYSEWKKPYEYAEKLAISKAHLTETLKQLTGRSAISIMHGHCMSEAERLLRFTDLSVKAISYWLGYPNTSHFIAIFSAQKDITPRQYHVRNLSNP